MIDPPVWMRGPVPVFSDLVSLQYVRAEVGGDILFGNSDLPGYDSIEPADPDDYLNRATDDFVDVTVDKVGTRFPPDSPTRRSPAATPGATTSHRTGTR